jgi:hypothetical protein
MCCCEVEVDAILEDRGGMHCCEAEKNKRENEMKKIESETKMIIENDDRM